MLLLQVSIVSSHVLKSAVLVLLFGLAAFGQLVPNRYTLLLEDPPVAARLARRAEMQSAAAIGFRQEVERRQAAIIGELRARRIHVTGSVSTLLNAVFVTASPDRVAELRGIPGVSAVRPMRRFKPLLNRAVQLMNAPAAWALLGGMEKAGQGVKIAILDSGIDQNHPAFQDPSLPMPAGFPKCTEGHPEDCAFTNNKVIVARSYVRDIAQAYVTDPRNPAAQSIPDDYSPRDREGHGTAVASAAAGYTNTGTVTFTGMAPKAYLGNYKLTGSPLVNDGPTDEVMIRVVEDAFRDGMDIASLSWGGPALSGALDTGAQCGAPTGAACDPVAMAYEAAARAGMAVIAAAGNEGEAAYFNGGQYPNFNSIASPATAPSVITVGATTNSHVMTPSVSVEGPNAPAGLKGMPAQVTDALPSPSYYGANSAPLVDVAQLGDDGRACAPLPAASLDGRFALIQAGGCGMKTKGGNAQAAGAVGAVIYVDGGVPRFPVVGLDFVGPVVVISNPDGAALKDYIAANPGPLVTIDAAGVETDLGGYVQTLGLSPAASNQLASYSSAGPAPDGSIKPDLAATGGFDASLAYSFGLYLAAQSYDPNGAL